MHSIQTAEMQCNTHVVIKNVILIGAMIICSNYVNKDNYYFLFHSITIEIRKKNNVWHNITVIKIFSINIKCMILYLINTHKCMLYHLFKKNLIILLLIKL